MERRHSDTRFQDDSNTTFYLHHTDTNAGSLRVQVLGPGLTQTFFHHYKTGNDKNKTFLDKKTSGFLAAVTTDEKRVVLAWGESGHGIGLHGDSLQAGDYILANAKWASKALKLAKILAVDFASPFDKTHASAAPRGSFQAAHVEVKLATYAILLMFHMAKSMGVRNLGDSITRESLLRLRRVRWGDQAPRRFEVNISRKNCGRCGTFLKKLQEVTGIQFVIKWGQRVVPIEYQQQHLIDAAQLGLTPRISDHDSTRPLPTYEENGIIHYMPLSDTSVPDSAKEGEQERRASAPARISPHHLSEVDKPLPATPVTEAPDWNSFYYKEELEAGENGIESSDDLPFPPRSPRPYGMCLR
ncbi:hypothetical protein PWT90_08918 [Aphanocladium album]|nr:hypothetical protein PWT90_08918 [Aphanocladium album]